MIAKPIELDLSLVDSMFEDRVREYYEQGDAEGVIGFMDNQNCLALVADNIAALKARGLYERALLAAYSVTRTNFRRWELRALRMLFDLANRAKLLEAGDSLPADDHFVLYRGVAGAGRERHVCGPSWTRDLDRAKWFAARFSDLRLHDPAVYVTRVDRADVLAYCGDRQEDDFILFARRYKRFMPRGTVPGER